MEVNFHVLRNVKGELHLGCAQASPLVLEFLVLFPHEVAAAEGLHLGEDLGKTLIPHVLQSTQHPCTEEHLGWKGLIKLVNWDGRYVGHKMLKHAAS